MSVRVYVVQQMCQANKQDGGTRAPIVVEAADGHRTRCHVAELVGRARVLFAPADPADAGGATVYVEADDAVPIVWEGATA